MTALDKLSMVLVGVLAAAAAYVLALGWLSIAVGMGVQP